MTVHGMQQHEQSSVEMQLHLPGWGLTTELAVEEMVDAGIFVCRRELRSIFSRKRGQVVCWLEEFPCGRQVQKLKYCCGYVSRLLRRSI